MNPKPLSPHSWNAWARSAFHEAELQLFADSASLGTALATKWVEAANRQPYTLLPGEGCRVEGGGLRV